MFMARQSSRYMAFCRVASRFGGNRITRRQSVVNQLLVADDVCDSYVRSLFHDCYCDICPVSSEGN